MALSPSLSTVMWIRDGHTGVLFFLFLSRLVGYIFRAGLLFVMGNFIYAFALISWTERANLYVRVLSTCDIAHHSKVKCWTYC